MLKSVIGAAVGAGMICAAVSAQAEVLKATLVDGSYSVSWLQDSNPTPDSSRTSIFTDIAVWDVTGSATAFSTLSYYGSLVGGGFGMFYGPQIYSGSESSPVFSAGTYTGLYDTAAGLTGGVLTLAAVPEPATWGMMLVGFAGLGALYSVNRRRALAA
jgi:hypothetical protein